MCTKSDNCESRVTDLANELNVSKDSLGSVISDKFIGKSSSNEILKILEKYDIDVLKYIKKCMKKKKNKLFDIIMERRAKYVEKVRRIYKAKKEKEKEMACENDTKKRRVKSYYDADGELRVESDDDRTIDFTGDPDDTSNLACGVQVISNGISSINELIEKKIEQTRNKNREKIAVCCTYFVQACILFIGMAFIMA
jgi:hypothetical protein